DDPERESCIVWSPFPSDTNYFAPNEKPFMINFQVENLDELLVQLKREGVDVDPDVENYDYGKFGWAWIQKGTASNCGSRRVSNSCANSQQGFSVFHVERFVISTQVKRRWRNLSPFKGN